VRGPVSRLGRPPCGKALPFRPDAVNKQEAMPVSPRRSLAVQKSNDSGKAQPYRTVLRQSRDLIRSS